MATSDMVVALKEASAHGTTLFGLNHHAPASTLSAVRRLPGRICDAGEMVHTPTLALLQARQTFTVLGVQPIGTWGFSHGVNEHQVAVGITDWKSRLTDGSAALTGPDLVRLALERGHSAHHAVEVLADLLEHYGQSQAGGEGHIFLIADANDAFVLETTGRFWALLECGHTRVVTDVGMIRQDWRRLASGLADYVIEQGWAQDDGSKIDFMRCLGEPGGPTKHAQKRWGRASLALAQQQGAIDLHYLRRMLADHYRENRDILPGNKCVLSSSFLIELPRNEQPVIAWVAFGAPKVALYFPLCLAGELPTAFGEGIPASPSIQQRTQELHKVSQGADRAKLESMLDRLQTKFDQDVDDYLTKAHDFTQQGKPYLVGQAAAQMMQHHVELFDTEYRCLLGLEERAPNRLSAVEEVEMFFA